MATKSSPELSGETRGARRWELCTKAMETTPTATMPRAPKRVSAKAVGVTTQGQQLIQKL
eukprot:6684299-Alexandrium_andersonii.AAC.1